MKLGSPKPLPNQPTNNKTITQILASYFSSDDILKMLASLQNQK